MLYNVEPKIKEAYISKANSMVLGGWRESKNWGSQLLEMGQELPVAFINSNRGYHSAYIRIYIMAAHSSNQALHGFPGSKLNEFKMSKLNIRTKT